MNINNFKKTNNFNMNKNYKSQKNNVECTLVIKQKMR